jgi:hypothetical protein
MTTEKKIEKTLYEIQRNALIPKAVAYANQSVGKKPKNKQSKESWAALWTRVYHRRMNKLWHEFSKG